MQSFYIFLRCVRQGFSSGKSRAEFGDSDESGDNDDKKKNPRKARGVYECIKDDQNAFVVQVVSVYSQSKHS